MEWRQPAAACGEPRLKPSSIGEKLGGGGLAAPTSSVQSGHGSRLVSGSGGDAEQLWYANRISTERRLDLVCECRECECALGVPLWSLDERRLPARRRDRTQRHALHAARCCLGRCLHHDDGWSRGSLERRDWLRTIARSEHLRRGEEQDPVDQKCAQRFGRGLLAGGSD